MNGQRDIERTLDAWFVDGPSVMPDRVFDAVFDQVERTSQRRLARLNLRLTEMNPRNRILAAAAAVAVVAVVGFAALVRNPTLPGATPSLSPSPSPTGVPTALQETWMGAPKPIPGNDDGAGVTLNFSAAGSFWMTQSASAAQQRLRSGATFLSGGRVELLGAGGDANCAEGDRGTYAWTVSPSGRTLTITAETDACAVRLASVPGTYWRMDCPTADDNCLGAVDAGTYSSQFFDPFVATGGSWMPRFGALTWTVPDGWINVEDWPAFFQLRPADAEDGRWSSSPRTWSISDQAEPCAEVQDPTIGTTAADIATWLSTAPGVVATDPQPVTIGGLDGFRIDICLDPAWTEPCPWSEDRPVRTLFVDRSDGRGISRGSWSAGTKVRQYFLDVGERSEPDGRHRFDPGPRASTPSSMPRRRSSSRSSSIPEPTSVAAPAGSPGAATPSGTVTRHGRPAAVSPS